jgi:hypothetical protein
MVRQLLPNTNEKLPCILVTPVTFKCAGMRVPRKVCSAGQRMFDVTGKHHLLVRWRRIESMNAQPLQLDTVAVHKRTAR